MIPVLSDIRALSIAFVSFCSSPSSFLFLSVCLLSPNHLLTPSPSLVLSSTSFPSPLTFSLLFRHLLPYFFLLLSLSQFLSLPPPYFAKLHSLLLHFAHHPLLPLFAPSSSPNYSHPGINSQPFSHGHTHTAASAASETVTLPTACRASPGRWQHYMASSWFYFW